MSSVEREMMAMAKSGGGKKSAGSKSRSAKTGRYVTKKYAEAHPHTTVTERNPKPSRKK